MTDYQNFHLKNKLTRFFWSLAWLASFFFWGEFIYTATAPLPPVVKTEVVFTVYLLQKTGIPYQSAGALHFEKYSPPNTDKLNFSPVSWHFNRLIKIKSNQFTQVHFSLTAAGQLLQVKMPQPNPDGDPLLS